MLTKGTNDNGQIASTGLWWDESRQMHTSMIFTSNSRRTFYTASYSDDTKVSREKGAVTPFTCLHKSTNRTHRWDMSSKWCVACTNRHLLHNVSWISVRS